tara:strand:+ start:25 stop:552 length:528 start_codon:yes stop_codon:yes gene_type:complete
MNLSLAIGVNFFIAFLIPIVLYFGVLKPGIAPISEFILVPAVCFGVMFFLAFMTSIIASKEKCDSFNWTTAFVSGIKTPLAVCITYAIIFLIPDFTFPFMKITGPYANEPVVAYIAQAILLAFATLPATASVWLSSEKYGCTLSAKEITEMNRQTAEELNQSPPDPNQTTKQVTI